MVAVIMTRKGDKPKVYAINLSIYRSIYPSIYLQWNKMPIYFHSAPQKSPIQGETTLEKIVKELVAKRVLLLFFLHLLVPHEKSEGHSVSNHSRH